MKNPNLLFVLLCFVLSISVYGQGNMKTVTLTVDTRNISVDNADSVSDFGQDKSQVSNTDFTVDVSPGDIIRWRGIPANTRSGDIVKILSIDHESGTNFFNSDKISNSGSDGFLLGAIDKGNPGDIQKYSITFEVYNNGVKREGKFIIDPKFRIRI